MVFGVSAIAPTVAMSNGHSSELKRIVLLCLMEHHSHLALKHRRPVVCLQTTRFFPNPIIQGNSQNMRSPALYTYNNEFIRILLFEIFKYTKRLYFQILETFRTIQYDSCKDKHFVIVNSYTRTVIVHFSFICHKNYNE